jgi:hypothetical protein
MTIRVTLAPAALLALGLLLAACAAETVPAAEVEQPVRSTAGPTSNQPPATSNQSPITGNQPPTPSRPSPPAAPFRDLGPAPEISNDVWLNIDRPLPLSSLRGQVVLIEFWTFG